jgi:hypothetical protein
MTSHEGSAPARPGSWRQVAAAIARILFTTVVLFLVYAQAPLELPNDRGAAARLAVSVLVLVVVLTWQIVAVARSPYPAVRAIEAVAFTFPLLIFLFASTYYGMEQAVGGSFSEGLSRIDAVYLTVTIFATVGFGDIVPTTEASRIVVTVQMVVNMALIGVVAKVLLGTVQQRRAALGAGVRARERERERAPDASE